MYSIRTDILVAILTIATLLAVSSNHIFRRQMEIRSGDAWNCHASDDRLDGGTSTSQCNIKESHFELQYKIGEEFHTPYTLISFRPESGQTYDLSWVEQVRINARASCEQHLLFQVRNFEPGVTDSDPVSKKYNEAIMGVGLDSREIVLDRADFNVPSWWLEKFLSQGATARIDFSRAEWFEFVTRGSTGSGSIQIESVSFEGHWISTASLNQGLLWLWLGVAVTGLLTRIRGLRTELVSKRKAQEQLSETNSLLELKSKEYSDLARRDPLTELMNRFGIHESLHQLFIEESCKTFSIIFFDVDRFKTINDASGHSHGDNVLCDIGTITKNTLRGHDLIARWGGDEFLIVLPDTKEIQAATVAEGLRKTFASSTLGYTCSFGVAESKDDGDFHGTFKLADEALYRSKEEGRDVVYTSAPRSTTQHGHDGLLLKR